MERKPFIEKQGFLADLINFLLCRRLYRVPKRTLANGGKVYKNYVFDGEIWRSADDLKKHNK